MTFRELLDRLDESQYDYQLVMYKEDSFFTNYQNVSFIKSIDDSCNEITLW